jgi:hypothetical protein
VVEIEKNEKIKKGDRLQKEGKSRDDKKNIRKPLWGLDLGKQSILFAGVGEVFLPCRRLRTYNVETLRII